MNVVPLFRFPIFAEDYIIYYFLSFALAFFSLLTLDDFSKKSF